FRVNEAVKASAGPSRNHNYVLVTGVQCYSAWPEKLEPLSPIQLLQGPDDILFTQLKHFLVIPRNRIFEVEHYKTCRRTGDRLLHVFPYCSGHGQVGHLHQVPGFQVHSARSIEIEQSTISRAGSFANSDWRFNVLHNAAGYRLPAYNGNSPARLSV